MGVTTALASLVGLSIYGSSIPGIPLEEPLVPVRTRDAVLGIELIDTVLT